MGYSAFCTLLGPGVFPQFMVTHGNVLLVIPPCQHGTGPDFEYHDWSCLEHGLKVVTGRVVVDCIKARLFAAALK